MIRRLRNGRRETNKQNENRRKRVEPIDSPKRIRPDRVFQSRVCMYYWYSYDNNTVMLSNITILLCARTNSKRIIRIVLSLSLWTLIFHRKRRQCRHSFKMCRTGYPSKTRTLIGDNIGDEKSKTHHNCNSLFDQPVDHVSRTEVTYSFRRNA